MRTLHKYIAQACTFFAFVSYQPVQAAGPCLWGANSLANCLPSAGLLLDNQRDLRLGDSSGGEYVALEAPATIGTPYTITFPNAAPAVSGYALTATTAGVASWTAVLTNPMTTVNDIIYGGASGTPTRLGIGATNTVLTSTGAVTAPAWGLLVDANIDAAAAIDPNKLAPYGSAGGVLFSDGPTSFWTNAYEATVQGNILGNGAFNLWQRGTTFALPGIGTYTADRWFARRGNSAAGGTVTQQTAPDGVGFALRAQRDSGNSSTEVLWAGQIMPDTSSTLFRGRSLTLRFKYRTGANFSGANLNVRVFSTTNSNLGFTSAGIPSNSTDLLNTTVAANTTYSTQTLVTTANVGATANQIGVSFIYTPVGTASTNDWIEIAEVMLVPGTFSSLVYTPKGFSMADDKNFCMQFYEKSYNFTTNPGTSATSGQIATTQRASSTTALAGASVQYKVPKFASPTITLYPQDGSPTGSWSVNAAATEVVATTTWANEFQFVIFTSAATALVLGDAVGFFGHYTAEAELL